MLELYQQNALIQLKSKRFNFQNNDMIKIKGQILLKPTPNILGSQQNKYHKNNDGFLAYVTLFLVCIENINRIRRIFIGNAQKFHLCLINQLLMPSTAYKWTQYDDAILTELVQKYGVKQWTCIANKMKSKFKIGERTGKQCRQRWVNHLSNQLSKKPWTMLEDQKLFSLQILIGNKWSQISKQFPGRSDNSIKNHYFSMLRKSIRRMCKFAQIDLKQHKIYSIKPLTLSNIICKGFRPKIMKQRNVQLLSNIQKELCEEIAATMMKFIWKESSTKNIDEVSYHNQKLKIHSIIEEVIRINKDYQSEIKSKTEEDDYKMSTELEPSQKKYTHNTKPIQQKQKININNPEQDQPEELICSQFEDISCEEYQSSNLQIKQNNSIQRNICNLGEQLNPNRSLENIENEVLKLAELGFYDFDIGQIQIDENAYLQLKMRQVDTPNILRRHSSFFE